MVRIRLTRVGRKNAPAYRIVVIDQKAKRDGKAIEIIGNYNPVEDPKKVNYEKDRYSYWLSTGAQPSDTVKKLISSKYEYKPYNHGKKEEASAAETQTATEGDS